MEFTQNYWGQRHIITKTKIWTKQGSDKIHDVIPTKYQKYPSNKILKHDNVLAKVNKLPWGEFTQYFVTWRLQYSNSRMYNEPSGHSSQTKGVKSE